MSDLSAKLEITYTFKDFDSSESIKEYAVKKCHRLVKHLDAVMHCTWVFEKERNIMRTRLHAVSPGFDAHCTGEDPDDNLYAAIDAVTDKMDQQIKKHKGRQQA